MSSNRQYFESPSENDISNNVRTIAKNSLAGSISFLVNAALTLSITITLARYLGTTRFGYFVLIFGISQMIKTVIENSLGLVLVREISKDKKNLQNYIRRTKPLLWFLSLFLLFIIVAIIKIINPVNFLLLPLYFACAATIVILQNAIYEAVFRAMEVMEWNAFGIIFQKGVFLLLIYLFVIKRKLGLSAIFGSLLFAYTILWIIYHLIVVKKYSGRGFEFNYQFCRCIIKEFFPLSLARILRPLIFQMDTFILASVTGFQIVGIYNSAKRPLNMLNVIPGIIAIPLYPHYSRIAEKSLNVLVDIYKKSLKFMWILSLPIAVITTILSDRIIMLFYGKQYLPASNALRVLIWSVIFLFLSSQYQYLFTALKKQKLFSYIISITLVVNFGCNILLIPLFSFMGASYAALFSEIVLYLMGFFFLWRLGARLSIVYGLSKPALCSIIIGIIVFFLRGLSLIPLVLSCLLCFLIYLFLIFMLRTFSEEEMNLIKRIFAKG